MKAQVKAMNLENRERTMRRLRRAAVNVFADLGSQNAEARLLKAELATKIARLIEKKG